VLPRTAQELRAQRLGFALRSLAAELVDERRKVAWLRREIADLTREIAEPTARLECRAPSTEIALARPPASPSPD
jgi:uncharacterized protein involved in exopolysaccharide biosynthesis